MTAPERYITRFAVRTDQAARRGADMQQAANRFELQANYQPAGDQPEAIERLVDGLESRLVARRRCSASRDRARPSRSPT